MENQIAQTLTGQQIEKLVQANRLERERNAAVNVQKALQADNCELHTLIEFSSDGRIVGVQYKTVAL